MRRTVDHASYELVIRSRELDGASPEKAQLVFIAANDRDRNVLKLHRNLLLFTFGLIIQRKDVNWCQQEYCNYFCFWSHRGSRWWPGVETIDSGSNQHFYVNVTLLTRPCALFIFQLIRRVVYVCLYRTISVWPVTLPDSKQNSRGRRQNISDLKQTRTATPTSRGKKNSSL